MKKIKQAEEKEKSEGRQTQKSLFQESDIAALTEIKFHAALLQVIVTPYYYTFQSPNLGTIFRPPQAG